MAQNNTNRRIERFETDALGNTTKLILNTAEPIGLLEGDYKSQIEELNRRLNALTGGGTVVLMTAGGTAATDSADAIKNLTDELTEINSVDAFNYHFIAKRTGGQDVGSVYLISKETLADMIGALRAENNLLDLDDKEMALINLYNEIEYPLDATISQTFEVALPVIVRNRYEDPEYGDVDETRHFKIHISDFIYKFIEPRFLRTDAGLSDLVDKAYARQNLLSGIETETAPNYMPFVNMLDTRYLYLGEHQGTTTDYVSIPRQIELSTFYNEYIAAKDKAQYGLTARVDGTYNFDGVAKIGNIATNINVTPEDTSLGEIQCNFKYARSVQTPAYTNGDYSVTINCGNMGAVLGISVLGQDASDATYIVKSYTVSHTSRGNSISQTIVNAIINASSLPYGGAMNGFIVEVYGIVKGALSS